MSFNRKKHESFAALLDNPVTDYQRENIQFHYKDLINEHFDNQPLKFEELHKGMWVWDRRDNKYVHIYMTRIYEYDTGCFFKGQKLLRIYCDSGWYDTEFVENRFYRKQVEE